jgi:acyl-CoA thioesterase
VSGWRFDAHTAVGDRRSWRARVEPELSGFGGTHGGYLAAIALRAMAQLCDDPARPPRSLTIGLLAAVEPGDLGLEPELERVGSSMTVASLRLRQDGSTVAAALASFGRARESLGHVGVEMPGVPPPERCEPIAERPVPEPRAGLLVEHRPAAPPLPLTGGDRARILVWMRLVEDRPVDALSATMLADAAPPALYGRLDRFVAMPSAEIALHYATLGAAPESPWLLGDFRTCHAAEGYASEDGELWTPDGRLVLQVRQLRRVLG